MVPETWYWAKALVRALTWASAALPWPWGYLTVHCATQKNVRDWSQNLANPDRSHFDNGRTPAVMLAGVLELVAYLGLNVTLSGSK
jgi:hypothetical protein